MARNGSGTFSLVAGNPVVTGTTISSTWANNTLSDIASALTASVANDGQTPILANQDFGGFALNNVATPPQFDSDTSTATTAFVQRALGNFSTFVPKSAGFTVANTDVGTAYYINSAAATTINLPAAATMIAGTAVSITNINSGIATLTPVSGTIFSARGGAATYKLYAGDSIIIISDGGSYFVLGGDSLSAVYTPTLTAVANCSALTNLTAYYRRAGNFVRVDGSLTLTVTAAATTQFKVSLPIASAISNAYEVTGQMVVPLGAGVISPGTVLGNAADDTALVAFVGTGAGSVTIQYGFTYQIL